MLGGELIGQLTLGEVNDREGAGDSMSFVDESLTDVQGVLEVFSLLENSILRSVVFSSLFQGMSTESGLSIDT